MRSANLTTVGMRVLSVIGQRVFVSRCPRCAKLEIRQVSIFEFSGRQTITISVHVDTRKHRYTLFAIGLLYTNALLSVQHGPCGTPRLLIFEKSCLRVPVRVSSGVDASYLCDPDEVSNVIESLDALVPIEFLAVDDTRDDFFVSPRVMGEVLSRIRILEDRGDVYCQCGNDELKIEVFGDRVELSCQDCGSLCIVYAENAEDLDVVRDIDCILLSESGFSCVDSRKFGHGLSTPQNKRHSD